MPAWITTYLQNPPAPLSSDAIKKGIDAADWWTLGETVDLDEDQVDAFMGQLQWSDDPIEVNVEPDRRPIQLHAWMDSDRVRTEIAELNDRPKLGIPRRVRDLLPNVQGVVAIELGWSQLQTMYEIVAFEIAYWLAEVGDGVLLSVDDQWYDHDANRWEPIRD